MEEEYWSPKLQKQNSCTYAAGDIGTWLASCRRSVRNSAESDEETIEPLNFPSNSSRRRNAAPKWRLLWRRLTEGKKKRVFDSYSAPTYDPFTYSQNFDQGSGSLEPDNLARSFSMRFSDSSTLFRRFV